jgi:hypothetical protein
MLKNFFSLVLIILLAILWVLFAARPVALAQDKTTAFLAKVKHTLILTDQVFQMQEQTSSI